LTADSRQQTADGRQASRFYCCTMHYGIYI